MRTTQDIEAVKRTTVLAVTLHGELAGRVFTHITKSGVCYATVACWTGPLVEETDGRAMHGTAGGGGYCKRSAAVADAFDKAKVPRRHVAYGNGMTAVRQEFESRGYKVLEVL